MEQANAGADAGGDANGRGAAQPAAVPAPAAAHVAVVVAGPVIANLAGALPGHPRFDIGVALLGPLPTKSNTGCHIHAKID